MYSMTSVYGGLTAYEGRGNSFDDNLRCTVGALRVAPDGAISDHAAMEDLLCWRCGKPASHIHFIPWIEEPERVQLACNRCEPPEENEWFTLGELRRGRSGWMGRAASKLSEEVASWLRSLEPPTEAPSIPETALTDAQAAERIGKTKTTIQRWIRAGKLPAQKKGRTWFIATADLDALDDTQTVERAAPKPRRRSGGRPDTRIT